MSFNTVSRSLTSFSEVLKVTSEYINIYIRLIREINEVERRYGVSIDEIPLLLEKSVAEILRSGNIEEVMKVLHLVLCFNKYRNVIEVNPLQMKLNEREKLIEDLTEFAVEISRFVSSGER